MRQTLHATEQTLDAVFSDSYAFSIPPYQRPYAWTTEEAEVLLDDLLVAIGPSEDQVGSLPPYFLGSIVLIKHPESPDSEVVDGQQRVTTLTILFAALRELCQEEKAAGQLERFICERGDAFRGTKDRYRLQVRSRDDRFFRKNVQERGGLEALETDGHELRDSQKNMRENAICFLTSLRELTTEKRDRLGAFMAQRCFLVVVAASDKESAYRIFSVMNDRGLDLTATDILKAEVIGGIDKGEADAYTERWETIEGDLGRSAFEELFGHIRMVYARDKARRALTEEFRTHVRPSANPAAFIDDVLNPYATHFRDVLDGRTGSDEYSAKVDRHIRFLHLLDNNDWVAPALQFMQLNLDSALRAEFFRRLERLAYVQFINRDNITTRARRYGALIRAIDSGSKWNAPGSPIEIQSEEAKRVRRWLRGPVYETVRVRRPLLLRLDGLLSDEGARYEHRVITIEHVLPQTPPPNSKWLTNFPNAEERADLVHCIGNLALLSRRKNSAANNFEFERKKREYFSASTATTFALTTQIINEPDWTPQVVIRRREHLASILENSWALGENDM